MSGLFSKALTVPKQITRLDRKSILTIATRPIYFQDTLFGLENLMNLQRMIQYEKSGGPSMLMNAQNYDYDLPFFTDVNSVQGNDDTTRVFGLNTIKLAPDFYTDFPKVVFENTQSRHGLFEVSLQYTDNSAQWNPEALINYIAANGVEKLMNLQSSDLFETYLKRPDRSPKLTDQQILEMYRAVFVKNAPEMEREWCFETFIGGKITADLTEDTKTLVLKGIESADLSLPSFTDVEFGYFFFKLTPTERYNMSVVTSGGHIVETEMVAEKLKELLTLKKKKNNRKYDIKLKEFMEATKGDNSNPSRLEKIAASLRLLPVFNEIYKQNSSFMERNFEALCIKLDAYLLNHVQPSEGLMVVLQFPFVLGSAPFHMPIMFQVDNKGEIVVTELLSDSTLPLSVLAQSMDPHLAKSIKYCGTPSANIFISENADDLISASQTKTNELRKESSLVSDLADLAPLRQEYIYDLFSNDKVKLRRLNGLPIQFAAEEDHWLSRNKAMSEILTTTIIPNDKKFTEDTQHRKETWFEFETITFDGLQEEVDHMALVPTSADYYDWRPVLAVEIPKYFSKNRKLNELPDGFPKPGDVRNKIIFKGSSELPPYTRFMQYTKYPEHIGAASPHNTLTTKGRNLTKEEYDKFEYPI